MHFIHGVYSEGSLGSAWEFAATVLYTSEDSKQPIETRRMIQNGTTASQCWEASREVTSLLFTLHV